MIFLLISFTVNEYARSNESIQAYVWGLMEHGALGYGQKSKENKTNYLHKPSRMSFGEQINVRFNFWLKTIIFQISDFFIISNGTHLFNFLKRKTNSLKVKQSPEFQWTLHIKFIFYIKNISIEISMSNITKYYYFNKYIIYVNKFFFQKIGWKIKNFQDSVRLRQILLIW